MKVWIEQFSDYNFEKIYAFVKKTAEEINLKKILKDKDKILIKPNCLGAYSPDKAITTHPILVDVVVTLLKEYGKQILIGDSPGGTISLTKLWKDTGIQEVAEKHKIPIVHFGKSGVIEVKGEKFNHIIEKTVMDVDAIINLPKYKTHGLMLFTGAVKNLYGVIPGLKKTDYHRENPDPTEFADRVLELFQILKDKIVLHVMDGILGMDGEGPSAGNPKNFGVIFISQSAPALDFKASSMMGFDSIEIPLIKKSLMSEKLLPADILFDSKWENFVFENTDIGSAQKKNQKIKHIPSWILNLMKKFFAYYPKITKECKRCGICKKSCPVDAIIDPGNKKPFEINYKKCIKCLCCHEFCPYHVIETKKSFIVRMFFR